MILDAVHLEMIAQSVDRRQKTDDSLILIRIKRPVFGRRDVLDYL